MTGTSIDGLDVALVEIAGKGPSMTARIVRCESRTFGRLAAPLRRLAEQHPMSAGEVARLRHELALFHVKRLCAVRGTSRLDLICLHGQTVFHAPPLSWQLIDAAPVARELAAPVVFDLRAADLAAGGQGAPITPLADYVLFRSNAEERAVVNLGGFCNFTLVPSVLTGASADDHRAAIGRIRGGDVCACNQVLDAIARLLLCEPYDVDGAAALRGKLSDRPFHALAALLRTQTVAGRSLGTGDEVAEWLARFRDDHRPEDLARCACEAIGATIVGRLENPAVLILAGGGTKNRALVEAIARRTRARVVLSDELGVPAHFREAAAMAVLGALCQDRVPITLSAVTGVAEPPLAGTWVYP